MDEKKTNASANGTKEIEKPSSQEIKETKWRKGRGGRGNRGGNRSGNRNTTCRNDVRWYGDEESLKIVANVPFSEILGLNENYLRQPVSGDDIVQFNEASAVGTPGIMLIDYVPVFGGTLSSQGSQANPINVAAQRIYSWVRHMNSGSRNYEQSDLMLYLLSIDSLNILLSEMRRLMSLWDNYTVYNRYTPDKLIAALGGNVTDIQRNFMQYVYVYNSMVAKLNTLKIPNVMSLFKRHAYLSSAILVDHDNIKPQIYMYRAHRVYKFNAWTSSTGGKLDLYIPDFSNISNIQTMFNELLNVLITNEDIGIMSGDINKAYGDACYSFQPYELDSKPLISSDALLLNQLQNTSLLPFGNLINPTSSVPAIEDLLLDSMSVVQNNNILSQNIRFKITGDQWAPLRCVDNLTQLIAIGNYRKLTSYKESPTPDDIMEITRNICRCDVQYISKGETVPYLTITVNSAGSEIFIGARIYSVNNTSIPISGIHTQGDLSLAVYLSAFDWHPAVGIIGEDLGFMGYILEADNYTVLQYGALDRMHYVALMAEVGLLTNTTDAKPVNKK